MNTAKLGRPQERWTTAITYDLYSAPAQEWFSVADIAAVGRLARRYGSVAAMESALARLDLAVPAFDSPPPPSSRWWPRQAWSTPAPPPRLILWNPGCAVPPPPGYAATAWRPSPPLEIPIEPPRADVAAIYLWGVTWRFLLAGGLAALLLGGVPSVPAGLVQAAALTAGLAGLVAGLWRRAGAVPAAWRCVMVALAVVLAVGTPGVLPFVLGAGVALCLGEPAIRMWQRARPARALPALR